jgi:hypothetical protein
MLFNSPEFLLIFFPAVCLLYFLLGSNGKTRWAIWLLTLASIVFYAWWDWRFVFLMLLSTLIDYWAAQQIEQNKLNKKVFLFEK